jgi:hypothetical protein
MAAVPITRTAVAGEIVLVSQFNTYINQLLNFLASPPICQIRQTVAQSIPNATETALTFDAEDVDSSGMHSTSVNTSRMTAVYAGWYLHGGGWSLAAGATGRRATSWRVNGAGTNVNGSGVAMQATATSVPNTPAKTMLIFLNVSDYSEEFARQENGGALNTVVTNEAQPIAMALWKSN